MMKVAISASAWVVLIVAFAFLCTPALAGPNYEAARDSLEEVKGGKAAQGYYSEAAKDFEQVATTWPEERSVAASALLWAMTMYQRAGEIQRAHDTFKTIISEYPDDLATGYFARFYIATDTYLPRRDFQKALSIVIGLGNSAEQYSPGAGLPLEDILDDAQLWLEHGLRLAASQYLGEGRRDELGRMIRALFAITMPEPRLEEVLVEAYLRDVTLPLAAVPFPNEIQDYYEPKVQQCRRIISANPAREEGIWARYALAGAHLLFGKIPEAIAAYQDIEALFPTSPVAAKAAMRRAQVHFQRGNLTEALPAAEAAIRVDASSYMPAAGAVEVLRQIIVQQEGSDHALSRLEQIAIAHPGSEASATAMYEKGRVFESLGRGDEAIAAYEASISHDRIFQGSAEALKALENYYLDRGQYALAGRRMREMLRLCPSVPNYGWAMRELYMLFYDRGNEAFLARKYKRAMRIFRAAVVANFPDEYAYTAQADDFVGHCYMSLHDYDAAISHFSYMIAKYGAVEAFETAAASQYQIGQIYSFQGRAAEALAAFQKVLDLYPNTTWNAAAAERIIALQQQP